MHLHQETLNRTGESGDDLARQFRNLLLFEERHMIETYVEEIFPTASPTVSTSPLQSYLQRFAQNAPEIFHFKPKIPTSSK
jgi:hypothetical protein